MRKRSTVGRLVTIGLVVASSSSLVVARAYGAPRSITIDCASTIGTELTEPGSYVLERGVRDCASDVAIRVSVSDVVVNLSGRIIDGSGEGSIGVDAVADATNVTIRNGAVRDFNTGVQILGAGGVVKQIASTSNSNGVLVGDGSTITGCTVFASVANGIAGGDDNTITGNVVSGPGDGIDVFDGNTITGNTSERGRFGIVTGDDNTISRNVASGNTLMGIAAGGNNVVKRNVTIGNAEHGIILGRDNVVRANRASRNGIDGIVIAQPDATTTVRDNVANRNGNFGIEAGPGVVGAGTNSASGNGSLVAQCDPEALCN